MGDSPSGGPAHHPTAVGCGHWGAGPSFKPQDSRQLQEVNGKDRPLHPRSGSATIVNRPAGGLGVNTHQKIVCASAVLVASIVIGASYRSSGMLETPALLIVAGIVAASAMFYTMLGDKD